MLRFNKNFTHALRFFGGGKVDPSLLISIKNDVDPQIRDKIHLQYMTQQAKSHLYQQSRVRKTFSLYNIMSALPTSITQQFAKLSSDPKVILKSDNLYLPRLTKNGVPIYDSLRSGKLAILMRSAIVFLPLLYAVSLHYPWLMLMSFGIAYGALYRPLIGAFYKGLVIKMELVPQSQEILIQKAGWGGCCKTTKVRIDDLQIYDKSKLNSLFLKTARAYIDENLVFRVKSTGQLLFFDIEGIWYESGLNHELLV